MRLYEIASPAPIKSLSDLWHIGSLNPTHKRHGSQEGAGLSVSQHPSAWSTIGEGMVQGDLWRVSKPGNRFLMARSVTKPLKAVIKSWALERGLVVDSTLYRVSYYDDEQEETMSFDCTSLEGAQEEAENCGGEVKTIKGSVVATDKLRARTLSKAEPIEVPDLLLTVYAEDFLKIDGVWWSDRLDVQRYSAPRGVIVPSMVSTWKFDKADWSESPDADDL